MNSVEGRKCPKMLNCSVLVMGKTWFSNETPFFVFLFSVGLVNPVMVFCFFPLCHSFRFVRTSRVPDSKLLYPECQEHYDQFAV